MSLALRLIDTNLKAFSQETCINKNLNKFWVNDCSLNLALISHEFYFQAIKNIYIATIQLLVLWIRTTKMIVVSHIST